LSYSNAGEAGVKKSTDRRILKLAEKLEEAKIDQEITKQILEGGDAMGKSVKPEDVADWFRGAMLKMDNLIDKETRYAIREGCACLLAGQKEKSCLKIAQENKTLEDRVKAVSHLHYICGDVFIDDNGDIKTRGDTAGKYGNKCVCLIMAKEPVSITYCYCCGGHFKHHLQTALGVKLECTAITTPLSTGNKTPCTFRFKVIK
jgi:hypothetical protein